MKKYELLNKKINHAEKIATHKIHINNLIFFPPSDLL